MGGVRVFGDPFAPIPIWLLASMDISDGAKVLWGYFRWRQGPHPDCWPSGARIAADLGITRRQALRRLDELERAGYIEVLRRAGCVNRYTVCTEPTQKGDLSDAMVEELRLPVHGRPEADEEPDAQPVTEMSQVRDSDRSSDKNVTGGVTQMSQDLCQKCHTNYIKELDQRTRKKDSLLKVPTHGRGQDTWQQVLEEVRRQLREDTFNTWVKNTTGRRVDGHWEVTCVNEYAADWLGHRLVKMLRRTIEAVTGQAPGELVFVVGGEK